MRIFTPPLFFGLLSPLLSLPLCLFSPVSFPIIHSSYVSLLCLSPFVSHLSLYLHLSALFIPSVSLSLTLSLSVSLPLSLFLFLSSPIFLSLYLSPFVSFPLSLSLIFPPFYPLCLFPSASPFLSPFTLYMNKYVITIIKIKATLACTKSR
jgi:hypothetical protein